MTDTMQKGTLDVKKILERMKQAVDVQTDGELAGRLNTTRSTIASWRQRGNMPFGKLVEFCRNNDVSPCWILFGVGPRRLTDVGKFDEIKLKIFELLAQLDETDLAQVIAYVKDKVRLRKLEGELRQMRKKLE